VSAPDEPVMHTPGPWEYFPAQNYEGFAIAPRGRLPTLAAIQSKGHITAFNYPGQTEPNARLIAAAPEMLAMLKRIPGADWTSDDVRAVIAKAEGRS
jgi:hypothetical protein